MNKIFLIYGARGVVAMGAFVVVLSPPSDEGMPTADTIIITRMTIPNRPKINIIFMFFHQYFLLIFREVV